ncbi:YwdI family protein [Alkalihalobacillus macyae]|uniref:YwdI family protein n=1 Tax=Guptibacillus hwajinpoensis TaxID=208199 RepID=UPI00273C550B|nr:YwdI family protein [Alkalihalobacillus macyae]MDP4551435.1 YwdI family protein [Alkalihalobacillus macyae]
MKDIPINQLVHQMNARMKELTYNVEENDADVDGIREELIAIKTYCDMLLQASESKPKRQAQPLARQRPVPQAPVQQQSLSSKPKKEDDANEESIFDF